MNTSKDAIIELIDNPVYFSGYVFGFTMPCLRYQIKSSITKFQSNKNIDDFFFKKLLINSKEYKPNSDVFNAFQVWIGPILRNAGHPVFDETKSINLSPENAVIFQPCFNQDATLLAVNFILKLISDSDKYQRLDMDNALYDDLFSNLIKKLEAVALKGFNSIHFIKAAHDLDIPWTQVTGGIIQLGIGSKLRLINSSFTDQTSLIGTKVAREKSIAAQFLDKAGLPVPRHFFAKDQKDVIKVAKFLGYPIVIKPSSLDGGLGVKANIHNEHDACKAFDEARKFSDKILVQKHVLGRDYRLQIVNNECHGIFERIPGGVIGDGLSTIIDLINKQNIERTTAQDDRRFLHQIKIDDESLSQLFIQDLNLESIPELGCYVRLRGAANVSSGGIPVQLSIEDAHEDNILLAIRASRILKLDVSGVDLIIGDISKSWLEIGAHIIEVNAQPQMFTTMHKPMITKLFANSGSRIPVIVHLTKSNSNENNLSMKIHHALNQRGLRAGLVHDSNLWIEANCIRRDVPDTLTGARMLLCDSAVDVIVICSSDTVFINNGWPTDLIDILIFEDMPQTQDCSNSQKKLNSLTVKWGNLLSMTRLNILLTSNLYTSEIFDIFNSSKSDHQEIIVDFTASKEIENAVKLVADYVCNS